MRCPECGFVGIRAEFSVYSQEKGWNNFICPECGKTGDKNTFTPEKQEAEG